jgi:hypothetical protein
MVQTIRPDHASGACLRSVRPGHGPGLFVRGVFGAGVPGGRPEADIRPVRACQGTRSSATTGMVRIPAVFSS